MSVASKWGGVAAVVGVLADQSASGGNRRVVAGCALFVDLDASAGQVVGAGQGWIAVGEYHEWAIGVWSPDHGFIEVGHRVA